MSEGDGSFYAPKIDFVVTDSQQRRHQLGTIQLDYQLPRRFNLKYDEDEHTQQVPVLVHRAALGSLERFMALYAEQVQGKWPVWCSPRQVLIVPVSPRDETMVAHAN